MILAWALAGATWAAEQTLVVIDDEGSIDALLPHITSGEGEINLETDDVVRHDADGEAAVWATIKQDIR